MALTVQEQKFADEVVFQYFNSEETDIWSNAVKAAKYAGYVLPEGKNKSEEVAKAIYNKDEVKTYIENEISKFKEKLQPEQRRNLWATITGMTIGEPTEWQEHGLIKSNI